MTRDPDDITALIPAGGWRIEQTIGDGVDYIGPLVGWAVKDGLVVPLTTDGEGYVTQPTGEFRIFHPEEETLNRYTDSMD